MANFISIPVTNGTPYVAGQRLIGVNFVAGILATGTATVVIYNLNKTVTLSTTAAKAVEVVDAITAALSLMPGANIVEVDLPAGVQITAVAIA